MDKKAEIGGPMWDLLVKGFYAFLGFVILMIILGYVFRTTPVFKGFFRTFV